MKQTDWFDRKFDFSSQENTMPSLLERLQGTPLRLREKLKNIHPFLHTRKPDGKWSILEHAGHLSDLEPLWQGRLADILNGEKELRPTDLSNRKTTDAGHNNTSVEELLDRFDAMRRTTLNQLQCLSEEDVFRSALHPRLKTRMRTIDLFTFVAEHDDHHLAKITSLGMSK
jgi:uncharacterized damage-inducible protein DinB